MKIAINVMGLYALLVNVVALVINIRDLNKPWILTTGLCIICLLIILIWNNNKKS